jgi:hypothetical protein
MWLLTGSAVFQGMMIILVASGVWKYKGQETFINGVAAETFFQIAGMGYIVVRCLFPPPDSRSRTLQASSNRKKDPKPSGK